MDTFVQRHAIARRLIVQPRMGVPGLREMREYLQRIKASGLPVIGTLTLDSYTRLNQLDELARKLEQRAPINGFPLCSYAAEDIDRMLEGVLDESFPIQVRHGSPRPQHIFRSALRAGLHAGEGGPVSYCLPYSRVPLADAMEAWRETCELFQQAEAASADGHLESFGGCMLGQLCPPAILVALSVLECMFFIAHGIRSVSVSYAQGYNSQQDVGALLALRQLAQRFLLPARWHVVLYTFMGMFPQTRRGARKLIEESVYVATLAQAERLIVKTAVEAFRIPGPADNLEALRWAAAANNLYRLQATRIGEPIAGYRDLIHHQATKIIERTLDLSPDIGAGIREMFARGYLDVPYCIHHDNRNEARTIVADTGEVRWVNVGKMGYVFERESRREVAAADLLRMLSYAQRKYDGQARGPGRSRAAARRASANGYENDESDHRHHTERLS